MKKISDEGINLLVEFEGEILKVYKDPVGLPTLGVGHLVTPAEKSNYPVGKRITRAESRAFLRRDVERFENCINENVKVPITQNQFDALLSLAFNIGEAGFKRSSVLRHLNNRKFEKAANAFLAWNKADGQVLPGLTRRRNAERSVFLTPDEPESTAAQSLPVTTDEQQPAQQPASEPPPPSNIVKQDGPPLYQGVGFWSVIKRDLSLATGGNLSFSGLSEYAQQASGWPEWVVALLGKVAVGALIATVGYFIFRVVHYFVDTWKQNQRTKLLADINTDMSRKDLELG